MKTTPCPSIVSGWTPANNNIYLAHAGFSGKNPPVKLASFALPQPFVDLPDGAADPGKGQRIEPRGLGSGGKCRPVVRHFPSSAGPNPTSLLNSQSHSRSHSNHAQLAPFSKLQVDDTMQTNPIAGKPFHFHFICRVFICFRWLLGKNNFGKGQGGSILGVESLFCILCRRMPVGKLPPRKVQGGTGRNFHDDGITLL